MAGPDGVDDENGCQDLEVEGVGLGRRGGTMWYMLRGAVEGGKMERPPR